MVVIGTDKALWGADKSEESDEDYPSLQFLAGTVDLPVPIAGHRNLLHVFYRSAGSSQNLGSIAQDCA